MVYRKLAIPALCFLLGAIGIALAQGTGVLRPEVFVSLPWTWTGIQSFNDGKLALNGSSSGSSTVKAPATGGGTATLPAGTGTLAYVDPLATGSSTGNTFTAPTGYFVCTSTCTVTPPVPAAGYQFCVMNDDNVATVITLGAIGSSSRYENTARTAYGTAGTGTFISGGAIGDMVCIVGRDSTHYLTTTFKGTWTAS
jgi:hypothetical protein